MSDAESFPPYTFADTTGKRWSLKLTYAQVKKMHEQIGLDIETCVEKGLAPLAALSKKPSKLIEALYCVAEDQLTAAGVTPGKFGGSFDGDVLWAAWNALVAAVIDFFPNPHVRTVLGQLVAKNVEVTVKVGQMALDQFDVDREAGKFRDLFGDAPDS
jgi:hypothetical protein